MRTYLIAIALIIAVIYSCKTQAVAVGPAVKDTTGPKAVSDTVRIANDELEYEIIIIDPGFNYWLQSHARARGYYSQQYLESKNRIWVVEWNNRVMQPQRYHNLYQMRIDYQPSINYGYEVNYLLYNYLVYFQLANEQQLVGIVPQF